MTIQEQIRAENADGHDAEMVRVRNWIIEIADRLDAIEATVGRTAYRQNCVENGIIPD